MEDNKLEKELFDAMDKVTVDIMNKLEHGEERELNDTHTLYKYTEDDIIVIVETEDWEEKLQLLTDGETIDFESLT